MYRLALGLLALLACDLALSWGLAWGTGIPPHVLDGQTPVTWSGVWHVARGGLTDVALDGRGAAALFVDRHLVYTRSEGRLDAPRRVLLGTAYHPVEIRYEPDRHGQPARLLAAPMGGPLVPVKASALLPAMPAWPRTRAVAVHLADWTHLAAIASFAVVAAATAATAAAAGVRRLRAWSPHVVRRLRTAGVVTALVLAAGLGTAIRLDAITAIYGPVERPAWLHAAQLTLRSPVEKLRPAALQWSPAPRYPHRDGTTTSYRSDPYTYLGAAREMRSFAGAHYREPVFPFATRTWLRLLDDQDVAVSFASAMFSVLAIGMTYLMGAAAFSRPAGVIAAALLAIEADVIQWDVSGWRDTAFLFAVVAVAHAALLVRQRASPARALWLGVAAGIACLVRITALSFVAPLFVMLLLAGGRPSRAHAARLALAAATMALVVGPYLVNCWITFGDPLYAINVHADVYAATEGRTDDADAADRGALTYLRQRFLERPFRTIDTVAVGLTSYPFLNKWQGFDVWLPGLGGWLGWASLAGLVLFIGSPAGRLLLATLVTSLVPFAFTWSLIADWRFTEHAYPFFLLAAAVAVCRAIALLDVPRLARARETIGRRVIAAWRVGAAGLAAVAMAGIIAWGLPVLLTREALAAGEDVSIAVSARDRALFRGAWSAPIGGGNVVTRVSSKGPSIVRLPLPAVAPYSLTIRADPFPQPLSSPPAPLPRLALTLNGVPLEPVDVGWNPDRVGAYRVELPVHAVRTGMNRLVLQVAAPDGAVPPPVAGLSDGGAVSVWYIRVHPPAPDR